MTEEIWKTIPRYPKYQASSFGRIRSGNYRWSKDWRIMKPRRYGNRLAVNLHQDGVQYTHFVHHLVLWAFVGECPKGMECCHRNDDGDDNRIENLRWDTHKANVEDKIRNGRTNVGEDNHFTKTKVKTIVKIKELGKRGLSDNEIAKKTGATKGNVWNILNGKSWRSVK